MSTARARRLAGALVVAVLALGASPAAARLRFTRADGSAIRFHARPHVWCGSWEPDVPTPTLHVDLLGRMRGSQLSVVRRDLQRGRRRFTFPNEFVWDRPRGALLFVSDRPNKASTEDEDGSGALRVTRATCRLGGVVAFRINATLDSEFFDGPPIRVTGTFRGRVSRP